MEHLIAGGIIVALGKLFLFGVAIRLTIAAAEYVCDRPWLVWTLAGFIAAAAYLSYERLWGAALNEVVAAVPVVLSGLMIACAVGAAWQGVSAARTAIGRARKLCMTFPRWTTKEHVVVWGAFAFVLFNAAAWWLLLSSDPAAQWVRAVPDTAVGVACLVVSLAFGVVALIYNAEAPHSPPASQAPPARND